MTNRIKVISAIFSAIIIFALLAGLVIFNVFFVHSNPVDKKFLTPWLGMRTFLEIGNDPYGEPAAQRTQLLYYGKLAESGQDPLFLNQSFASVILYFPLALINDYTTARVVWMLLLELFLIGSAYLCRYLFEWKLPIFISAAYFILAILGSQAIIPLLENDQVILVFIFLLVGLIGVQKESDELSGAAFALAFFQPSVTAILCLMIFWWVLLNRRKRIIWGAMMAWGFLILASFGLFPGWFLPFIHSFKTEFVFVEYQSTFGFLSDLWPAIGLKVATVLTFGMIILLILEWRAALKRDFRWFLWVVSLTLATFPLVGIPTIADNNIIFLIPLTYILKVVADRLGRRKKWLYIGIIILLIFMVGWALWLGSLYFTDNVTYNTITFFAPSFLLLAGLYWIRWWATRPPRTWMDTIEQEIN